MFVCGSGVVDPRLSEGCLALQSNAKSKAVIGPELLKIYQDFRFTFGCTGECVSDDGTSHTYESLRNEWQESLATWEKAAKKAGLLEKWEALRCLEGRLPVGILKTVEEGLTMTKHSTTGPEGNTISMHFFRPTGSEPIPCVYWMHGGGLTTYSITAFPEQLFYRMLARQGVGVCAVEFRNSMEPTELAPQVAPYPGGLNDCYAGLEWLNAKKSELGVSDQICLAGASGGANLALATAMKAKKAGQLSLLSSGIFAVCPFIAGSWPRDKLNKGILGESHNTEDPYYPPKGKQASVSYGSLAAFDAKDPLAWPGFATEEDVKSLPPVHLTVSELDVFRDEGVNFYRLCAKAGVQATCQIDMGLDHCDQIDCGPDIPDIFANFLAHIARHAAKGTPLKPLPVLTVGPVALRDV